MSFLRGFRKKLHNHFLLKELTSLQIKRQSVDFERARQIGILFNATELDERELVLNYAKQLKNAGKKVKLLAFLNSKKNSPNFSFHHFNKKDVDWLMRPKGEVIENFARQSFDILINLSSSANLPLDYIAAKSHGKFRIGPFHEQLNSYELMIDVPQENDSKTFLEEVITLLKKTKTTSYAA